jgi:UDP-2,3-diacylglucosamine pyrophosphatase LpxH
VVCGHIHHAEIRDLDGILYCNDGDWVESCTALVEHFDGRLEIVTWAERRLRALSVTAAPARSLADAEF